MLTYSNFLTWLPNDCHRTATNSGTILENYITTSFDFKNGSFQHNLSMSRKKFGVWNGKNHRMNKANELELAYRITFVTCDNTKSMGPNSYCRPYKHKASAKLSLAVYSRLFTYLMIAIRSFFILEIPLYMWNQYRWSLLLVRAHIIALCLHVNDKWGRKCFENNICYRQIFVQVYIFCNILCWLYRSIYINHISIAVSVSVSPCLFIVLAICIHCIHSKFQNYCRPNGWIQ